MFSVIKRYRRMVSGLLAGALIAGGVLPAAIASDGAPAWSLSQVSCAALAQSQSARSIQLQHELALLGIEPTSRGLHGHVDIAARPVAWATDGLMSKDQVTLSLAQDIGSDGQVGLLATTRDRLRTVERVTGTLPEMSFVQVGYAHTLGNRGRVMLGWASTIDDDPISGVFLNYDQPLTPRHLQEDNGESAAAQADADLEAGRQGILHDAMQAFHALELAVARDSLAARRLEIARAELEAERLRFSAGQISLTRLQEAESNYNSAEDARLQAATHRDQSQRRLERLVGAPVAPGANDYPAVLPPGDWVDWAELALGRRFDVQAARETRDLREQEAAFAAQNQGWRLSLEGNVFRATSDFDPNFAWDVAVHANRPLFGSVDQQAIERARVRAEQASLALANLEQRVRDDVEGAMEAVRAAERRIEVRAQNLERALESLELVRARIQEGLGVQLDEERALVAVRDAEISLLQAGYERDSAVFTLRRQMGEPGWPGICL